MEHNERRHNQQDTPDDLPLPNPSLHETDSHKEDQEKEADAQANKTGQKYRPSLYQRWKKISLNNQLIVVFTLVIALSTFGYAILAAWQLRVMSGQLEQMRLGSRAWVGLNDEGGTLRVGPLTINEQGTTLIEGSVNVRNFGDYPAQDVYVLGRLVLSQKWASIEETEREILRRAADHPRGIVVFPGPSRLNFPLVSMVEPSQMIWVRRDDGLWAFIVGCIFYRDQSGGQQHTTFAYQYQRRGSTLAVTFKPVPSAEVPAGVWVQCGGSVE